MRCYFREIFGFSVWCSFLFSRRATTESFYEFYFLGSSDRTWRSLYLAISCSVRGLNKLDSRASQKKIVWGVLLGTLLMHFLQYLFTQCSERFILGNGRLIGAWMVQRTLWCGLFDSFPCELDAFGGVYQFFSRERWGSSLSSLISHALEQYSSLYLILSIPQVYEI